MLTSCMLVLLLKLLLAFIKNDYKKEAVTLTESPYFFNIGTDVFSPFQ